MIKGFEAYTKELTHEERTHIMPLIRLGMSYHIGKSKAVTAAHISDRLDAKYNISLKPERIRKIIHCICLSKRPVVEGCILIASSKGYYLSDNMVNIKKWEESMQGRIDAQKARLDSVKNQRQRISQ